jgi:hypothetical protein
MAQPVVLAGCPWQSGWHERGRDCGGLRPDDHRRLPAHRPGDRVIGRIESGVLRTGETVEIWDGGRLVTTAPATIEMITSRRADPKTIGLLLGDVDKDLLSSGQTIRRPADTAGTS